MKIVDIPTGGTKLCHARPGNVVRLIDTNDILSETACVVAINTESSIPIAWRSQGLYDCGKSIMLINLETGVAVPIRSLSQRCVIYRDAELSLGAVK